MYLFSLFILSFLSSYQQGSKGLVVCGPFGPRIFRKIKKPGTKFRVLKGRYIADLSYITPTISGSL